MLVAEEGVRDVEQGHRDRFRCSECLVSDHGGAVRDETRIHPFEHGPTQVRMKVPPAESIRDEAARCTFSFPEAVHLAFGTEHDAREILL